MPSQGKVLSVISSVVVAVWTSLATMPVQGVAQVPEAMPANYGFIWEGQLSYSATPTNDAQWEWLRAHGVNTIVTPDHNRATIGQYDFEGVLSIPFAQGTAPTNGAARRFLRYVQDPDNRPVHLSATGGSDRITLLRALVHYAIDGQSMEAALAEARLGESGGELSARQEAWLRTWAGEHQPGSH